MTIISTAYLRRELPAEANDDENVLSYAVAQASSFINTWTSQHYDPFDDYTEASSVYTYPAPSIIVALCAEAAKAYYFLGIGQVQRDGLEKATWQDYLDKLKTTLLHISVAPEWKTQTISLNSNNAMVIGARSSLGFWPRVVPQTAQVVSATTNVWLPPDDWYIQQGGGYADEYPDAWYFYAESSSVEGTLRYMRTYRSDAADYMRYAHA